MRYAPDRSMTPNARLTLFFESVLGALERLRTTRVASLADEARKLYRGAMTKVLTKVAYWYPASTSTPRWRACRRILTSRRSGSASSPLAAVSAEF